MDIFEKAFNFKDVNFLRNLGVYHFFKKGEGSEGSKVKYDGRNVIMIGSNNYLGLTQDPRVKEAAIDAIKKYGTGCTGSRHLNGNLDLHIQLEEELASFVGKNSAFLFSTGFFANQGTLESISSKDDLIFSDSENHASIISGCQLSRSEIIRYQHNDMTDFAKLLEEQKDDKKGKIVVSDGVFSMGGDIVDLPGLVKASDRSLNGPVRIMIDDAHALGVMGPNGRGTGDHFNLTNRIDLIMSTFSKSLSSIGGFIAGDKTVIDYIRHKARSGIFTAAIPASAAASALKALEIMKTESHHREQLWENAKKDEKGFDEIGLDTLNSETPIIPIFVGDESKALKIAHELFQEGIFATSVLYPAVSYGHAIIRTSYMATHKDDELDFVLDKMKLMADKYNLRKASNERPKIQTQDYSFKEFNKLKALKAIFKSYLISIIEKI